MLAWIPTQYRMIRLSKKMVTRKTREILLFLSVLLLWGQAVASPFLMCSDMEKLMFALPVDVLTDAEMDVSGASTLAEHCAGMLMPVTSGNTASSTADYFVAATHTGSSSSHGHETAFNCALMCQFFCMGTTTLRAHAPQVTYSGELPAWIVTASTPFLLNQPPSDHFRPPASA